MTKQTYNELKNRIHVLEYENAGFKKDLELLKDGWTNEEHDKEVSRLVDEVEGKNINIEMLEKEVEMSMENHNEILLESLGNTDFFDWCNTGKEEVVDYIEHLEKEVEEMTVAMSIGCDIDDAHWKVRRTQTDDWVKMFKTNEQLKKANDELKEINKTLMKN